MNNIHIPYLEAKGAISGIEYPTTAAPNQQVNVKIAWGNSGDGLGSFKLLLNQLNELRRRQFAAYNFEVYDYVFTMPSTDAVLVFTVQRETQIGSNLWVQDATRTITITATTTPPPPPPPAIEIPWIPVAIGVGALAIVGGVIMMGGKRKRRSR